MLAPTLLMMLVPVGCETIPSPIRPHDEVSFHVSPLKPAYRVNERIHLSATLFNRGEKAILLERVWAPMSTFTIRITDDKGQSVKFPDYGIHRVISAPRDRSDYLELLPDQAFGYWIVTRNYDIRLSRPGVYLIAGRLSLPDYSSQLGFTMWTGTVHAADVRVRVLDVDKVKSRH